MPTTQSEGYNARQVLNRMRQQQKKLLRNHIAWSERLNKDVADANKTLTHALMFIMEKGLYAEFTAFEVDKAMDELNG